MANQDEVELLTPKTFNSGATPAECKILVVLAPRHQPYDESMDSLDEAMAHAFRSGVQMVVEKIYKGVPGFQNWGPAYNRLLNDPTITHLFSAADDMLYPQDILTRLASHGKDIICAIYRKAITKTIEPAGWEESIGGFLEKFNSGGVHEVQWASGHTMMIRRGVIEKMVEDYPELVYDTSTVGATKYYALALPMIRDGHLYHDDWAFSIRARQSGFRIWFDYGCRCRHYAADYIGFEELEVEQRLEAIDRQEKEMLRA